MQGTTHLYFTAPKGRNCSIRVVPYWGMFDTLPFINIGEVKTEPGIGTDQLYRRSYRSY
jgi:hypothetical protein